MVREDDVAETPRRANLPNAGGSRGKRSTVPPPQSVGSSLKYDPTLPPATTAYNEMPRGEYMAYPPSHTEPPSSTSNKRKRAKKERDDEWMPTAPPPPAPPPFQIVDNRSGDASMHLAMPTILSRSSSQSSVHGVPGSFETGGASSVFNEVPVAIHSFAETERRRNAANANPNSHNTVNLSELNHRSESSGATTTSTSAAKFPPQTDQASLWNQPSAVFDSHGRLSAFNLLFPSTTASVASKTATRESKRRRRDGDADRRSSSRRGAGADDDIHEVDMARFAVDPFRLIPQGLVDKIDSQLKPSAVTRIVASHVDNWINRAGFDGETFLQDAALLNAYYPCPYPTILDDVVVVFVFKRPELMERILSAMIERMQKEGESASAAKYPLVEAFTRRCAVPVSVYDKTRHDLACLTVLRLLLERNTEKYLLSPWIASCASYCSEDVIQQVWQELLRQLVNASPSTKNKAWKIATPLDQCYELLREEKLRARQPGDPCRLALGLIRVLIEHSSATAYKDLLSAPLACEAFEMLFSSSSDLGTLLEKWIELESSATTPSEAMLKVIDIITANCTRLSVKKTNWFVRHVVPFALRRIQRDQSGMERVLKHIALQYSTLLLGGVDKNEVEEIENAGSGVNDADAADGAIIVILGKSATSEKHVRSDVVVQLGVLQSIFNKQPHHETAVKVLSILEETWSGRDIRVPWSYVWGLVAFALEKLSLNANEDARCQAVLDEAFLGLSSGITRCYVRYLLRSQDQTVAVSRIGSLMALVCASSCTAASKRILIGIVGGIQSESTDIGATKRVCAAVSSCIINQLARPRDMQGLSTRPSVMELCFRAVDEDPSLRPMFFDHILQNPSSDEMLLKLLAEDDHARVSVAFKLVVARSSAPPKPQGSRIGTAVTDALLSLSYRAEVPVPTRHEAIDLLDRISGANETTAVSLLWTVIRYCTRRCCGCATALPASQVTDVAVLLADLSKRVISRGSPRVIEEVGDFIRQRLVSCGVASGRWNLFLALLLERVIQLGWYRLSSAPSLVQMVITPFSTFNQLSPSLSQDTVIQLRLVRSLCIVLLSSRSPTTASWVSVARMLTSRPTRAKLQRIAVRGGCATSSSLAQSISSLSDEIEAVLYDSLSVTMVDSTKRAKLVL